MAENSSKDFEIAYFIYSCPISETNYEIIDEIEAKFGIKINYSSVQRFRNNLPKMKKLKLEKSRKELLPILLFVIDELKCSIRKLNETDNKMKLKLIKELRECTKLYNELFQAEIKSIEQREPF